jgi:MFS family permease
MNYLNKLLTPYKGLPKEIYVIFFAKIINAMGCFVMPLLTLILTKKIGLSEDLAGLYMSSAGFFYMFASLAGGKLADTIGRKRVIMIFDVLAAICYIICGIIGPSMLMLVFIIAAGTCMTVSGPAHDSLIADLTTPENRNGAYALGYMGWNIGFAIGPIIGGLLFKNHLSIVFIGDAATALISLCLIFFFIKETIQTTKHDLTDENRKLEKRHEGSILSVLLDRKVLFFFALIAFGYNFVYSQWGYLMPLHSAANFGENGAKYYGIMAGANGIVVMLCTPFVTKFTEKLNNMRCMVIGGLLYMAGFGMLGFLNTLPFFFVSVFVFTLGEIILSINTSPFIANHTPMSHRGRMSALLGIFYGAGYTLGPAGMGQLLKTLTLEQGWLVVGVVAAVFSFFMYRLEKYDARMSHEEPNDVLCEAE